MDILYVCSILCFVFVLFLSFRIRRYNAQERMEDGLKRGISVHVVH